jgi:hypothetical protein
MFDVSASLNKLITQKHIYKHKSYEMHTYQRDNWYVIYNTLLFNLLKTTGHVMHQQFNIQQLYALPTLYLRVLFLSENKQRLVPLTA